MASFTLLKPTVAVVTNVEAEHLENYENSEDELWRAFGIFVGAASENVVLNADDITLCQKLDSGNRALTYSTKRENHSSVWCYSAYPEHQQTKFELCHIGYYDKETDTEDFVGTFNLGSPGHHNVSNALAALTAVWPLDIQPQESAKTLADFHGVKRRFQRIGEANRVLVYDDYGHHPTEVARTLETARDFLERPVVAVFQPHRYSRTQQMGHEFGPSFAAADKVIITELYSAFEEPIAGVSGRIVFDSVRQAFPDKPVFFASNLDEARRLALQHAQPGDAVFFMGAGDITKVPPLFLEDLEKSGMR